MGRPPRFSVIVPTPVIFPHPAVLDDLIRLSDAGVDLEILVAEGANPSKQRNMAASLACGEVLVFLDSDCRVDESHFEKIHAHMEAGREILGGPVHLETPAEPLEQLFQSFFAHPLLTGSSSARYRASGALRRCGDSQLILCNMTALRRIFVESGGFNEGLYPNEENEWMARLEAGGAEIWHDPDLVVHRPQRKTWSAFCTTLLGYGKGRTRQSLASKQGDIPRHAPLLALAAFLLTFLLRPRAALKAGLTGWLLYSVILRTYPAGENRLSMAAAIKGPLLPLLYAAGQCLGVFPDPRRKHEGEVKIFRWEPSGQSLRPFARTAGVRAGS